MFILRALSSLNTPTNMSLNVLVDEINERMKQTDVVTHHPADTQGAFDL